MSLSLDLNNCHFQKTINKLKHQKQRTKQQSNKISIRLLPSNLTNCNQSFTAHPQVLVPDIRYHITVNLRKSHLYSGQHCQRKESHRYDIKRTLRFGDYHHGKSEYPCNQADDCQHHREEYVTKYQDHEHERNKEQNQDKFQGQFQNSDTGITTIFLDNVPAVAEPTALAAFFITAFTALTAFATFTTLLVFVALATGAYIHTASLLLFAFNNPAILIVVIIVLCSPLLPTNIAKLIPTLTGHMITSLILLNNNPTFPALPIMQILLEKIDFPFVALSLMSIKQAFVAKLSMTLIATHNTLSDLTQQSFAVLSRTQFEVGIFGHQKKLMDFFIGFLNVQRQTFEKCALDIQHIWTTFVRAHDLFEIFDLVNHVVVKAGLTEVLFMFTFAQVHLMILAFGLFHFSFANLAVTDIPEVVYCVADSVSNLLPDFGSFGFFLRRTV